MIKYFMRMFLMVMISILSFGTLSYGETVAIAAEDDWIPYAKKDGTGLANEIIIAALKSVGIDVHYKVMPYSRVLKLVEKGNYIAGFNVPLDDESKSKYIPGKKALYDAISAYYFNKNKPLKEKDRDGLKNKETIGVVSGYGYGNHYLNLVKKGHILEEATRSETSNLKKLAKGRLDATIFYDKTANILIKDLNVGDTVVFGFINEKTPIYLAFSKKHPKGQFYADKFDEGMAIIQANGIYDKIFNTY